MSPDLAYRPRAERRRKLVGRVADKDLFGEASYLVATTQREPAR